MTSAQICIMIAIIVYLIGMIYIGFRCSKKNNSTDDFYLGGRKLGPFVTAMSAEASDMSSWLLMGLPGVAYLTGISDAGWTAIGSAIFLTRAAADFQEGSFSPRKAWKTVPEVYSVCSSSWMSRAAKMSSV